MHSPLRFDRRFDRRFDLALGLSICLLISSSEAVSAYPSARQEPAEATGTESTTAPNSAPISANDHGVLDPDLYEKTLEFTVKALEHYGVYDNQEELERIQRLGYEVAQQTGYDDVPFSFYLIDMPAPNALALPGGQIFVTRGMIDLGLNDDMLAALLGHEVGHVALDHHARMQRKSTLFNVLSQALLVGVIVAAENNRDRDPQPYDPRAPRESEGADLIQGTAAASLVLGELLLRGYSRDHEDESDREGQRWAAGAGFSPKGTMQLMDLLGSRLPQTKEYGYLQTHPFFDERVRAARARSEGLKRQDGKSDEAVRTYRQEQQGRLLSFSERKGLDPTLVTLLEESALNAWPQGERAEAIRLNQLHARRDALEAEPELARDFGELSAVYRRQREEVAKLTPESSLLETIDAEMGELRAAAAEIYPHAVEVLDSGVFETDLLSTFLSNWPDAPEVPRVALALGDALSRLGKTGDAVDSYLRAWRAAPESDEGVRARRGLRVLAGNLEELVPLQTLADETSDPELSQIAADRLKKRVGTFDDLETGADYLKQFPDGSFRTPVAERMTEIADKLYSELVLYQAVGNDVQAIDRIQKILTHAPLSKAADRLRDNAVLPAEAPAPG